MQQKVTKVAGERKTSVRRASGDPSLASVKTNPPAPKGATKIAVSLLLTLTEADLRLFGMLGSPGTQVTQQLKFNSLLDLLNLYETHRFHLEKSAQVMQTMALLLTQDEKARTTFMATKWLHLLVNTHQHCPSQLMIDALTSLAAACRCEIPLAHDLSKANMEVFEVAVQRAQSTSDVTVAAAAAAAIRHVAWNSVDVKTHAIQLNAVGALARHLPDAATPDDQFAPEPISLAMILQALASLCLEPNNKRQLADSQAIPKIVGVVMRAKDDFVVGASCCCIGSLISGKAPQTQGSTDVIPANNLLLQSTTSEGFIGLVSKVVSFLDTPAKSVAAAELLAIIMRSNQGSKHLVGSQRVLPRVLKIMTYCLQSRPLAYGSAVLCRKVCACLREVMHGVPGHQQQWVELRGVVPLLTLLDTKGYRNEITFSLQLLSCSCLLTIAKGNPDHVRAIGEEGGVRRLLMALKSEIDWGKEETKNSEEAPIRGKGCDLVLQMLTLLAVLCSDDTNKNRVFQSDGVAICLSVLDKRQNSTFLDNAVSTLEAASLRDERGESVRWEVQEESPVVRSRVVPPEEVERETYATPTQSNSSFDPARRNGSGAANDIQRLTSMIDEFCGIATSMGNELAEVLNDKTDGVDLLSTPTFSPQQPPTSQKKTSLSLDQVEEHQGDIQRLELAVQRQQQMVNAAEQQAEQARNKLVLCDQEVDAYQEEIAATDLSLLLSTEMDALADVDDDQSELHSNADFAAVHALASIEGDETAMDEINAMEAIDGNFGVADFGREDSEEDGEEALQDEQQDEMEIQEYRDSLVAELEIKTGEREEAERSLQACEMTLQDSRSELQDAKNDLQNAVLRLQHAQQQPGETGVSVMSMGVKTPIANNSTARTFQRQDQNAAAIERISWLHHQMLEQVYALEKRASSASTQIQIGEAAARGGSVDTQAILIEHEREKRMLQQRIEDAEERAEAFSAKIVAEYRTKKQMEAVKKQRSEMKLEGAVNLFTSIQTSRRLRGFTAWSLFVQQEHRRQFVVSRLEAFMFAQAIRSGEVVSHSFNLWRVRTVDAKHEQAEERANLLTWEKRQSQAMTKKLRDEYMNKRRQILGGLFRKMELRQLGRLWIVWRKRTRALMLQDMEMLQSSLRVFD